jgi:ABC-type nitrate/sulfonate/bicarbonate transport system permease component
MVQKAVWFSNQWWARYVFAILFIVIVPMIRNYINGQKDEPEDEEQSMLERFMEFERLNKRS